jgi:hypothetical protein
LQSYVQANYPTVYNNPNIGFDSYKAMAFTGLATTTAYNTFLSSLSGSDKQSAFNSLYSYLTYGGAENKCP